MPELTAMCRSEVKAPPPRKKQADLPNPSLHDLFRFALLRVLRTVQRHLDRPPVLFPFAESVCQSFFTYDEWSQFGDLETERGRLSYTLSRYPERGFPAASAATIRLLLYCSPILPHWKDFVPSLKAQAGTTVREMVCRMQDGMPSHGNRFSKADFLVVPVNYDVVEGLSSAPLKLWKRSLEEFASQVAKRTGVYAKEFLQIHAFLRDPIGGLERSFDKQLSLFYRLLDAFQAWQQGQALSLDEWKLVLAQAACESSYLASPLLEHVAYVHFSGHQQLPYVYVPLQTLPRSEFSTPKHVLEIVQEILLSKSGEGLFPIAPIAIASYPSLLEMGRKYTTIIVDGNHRVTAVALLQFLATQLVDFSQPFGRTELREYCHKRGFGLKWEVDLADVLDELHGDDGTSCWRLIKSRPDKLALFAQVKDIPALIVQEESFHTICVQNSSALQRRLLLPVHQALFSDELSGFALPNAGQLHGRPLSFKALPLIKK